MRPAYIDCGTCMPDARAVLCVQPLHRVFLLEKFSLEG